MKRDINVYLERPSEKGLYTQAWIRQEDYYKIKAAQVLKCYENETTPGSPFQEVMYANIGGPGSI